MSWKPEVIADSSGVWSTNRQRFATKEEAEASVRDLAERWSLVSGHRATYSPDPVNAVWRDGRAVLLETTP